MTVYKYVDTSATDSSGNGSRRDHDNTAHGGSNYAYDSIATALTGLGTLTDATIIKCAGGQDVANTVSVTGLAFASNALTIMGDDGVDDTAGGGDDAGAFDNDGINDGTLNNTIDTNFYYTNSTSTTANTWDCTSLTSTEVVNFEDIQSKNDSTSGYVGNFEVRSAHTVNWKRVRAYGGSKGVVGALANSSGADGNNFTFEDCILLGRTNGLVFKFWAAGNYYDHDIKFVNCTLYGSTSSYLTWFNDQGAGAVMHMVLDNCAFFNAGTGDEWFTGTVQASDWDTMDLSYCGVKTTDLSYASACAPLTSDNLTALVSGDFNSPGLTIASDFTPSSGSSALVDNGSNALKTTTDILGITRDSSPTLGAYEYVAAGGVDNLLADDISVTPTLSSPALAQGQVLLADNISVTPTLSSPVLAEDGTDNLLADDISVTPTLSSPALAQGQVLLADDISVTPTLSSPVLADFVPSTYTITSLQFQPDFNWTKIRNTTARSHILTDALNGVGNILKSDSTAALTAASQTVLAFNSNGVSYGSDNQVTDTGKNFISHNWYMAATTDTGNADGDISADIRANTTAGQSVVTYTADGVGSTVGHGLDEVPQLILIKKTSGGVQNWKVYSETMGATYTGYLNLSANFATGDADRITAVGVANFTVGGTFAVDTNEVTAYCFHSVPGYSKVDSYTGNGNADGPYVDLGFRPAFLMIKNTAQGSTNWSMFDNQRPGYNDSGFNIFANLPAVEPVALDQLIDFTSRGFKLRNNATSVNSNTVTHTYIAFAESPGNYSRAR